MRRLPVIRLTYARLALLVFGIWTGVFLFGFALSAFAAEARSTGLGPVADAEELYRQARLRDAERGLSEYLLEKPGADQDPEKRAAYFVLVRYRALFAGLESATGAAGFYLAPREFQGLLTRSPDTAQLRLLYKFALRSTGDASPLPPQELGAEATLALARLRQDQGETEIALKLYRHGLELLRRSESAASKKQLALARAGMLDALVELGWYVEFVETMSSPGFSAIADEFHTYIYRLKTGRYLAMIPPLVRHESGKYETRWVLAGLSAGACWLVFLLHMGRARHWPGHVFVLAVFALALGALSAYGTIVALLITEEYLPFSKLEPTFTNELIHMVFGVGLREELLKLLLFIPLTPFLMRKNNATVLTVAALVGLGFAIEENILYYADYGGGVIIARFLTANFLHMSLTGFAGYYLVAALRRGGESWSDFAAQFGLVILLHGAYDFLLGGQVENGGFLAMLVHIWLSYQFLSLFARLDSGGARRLPMTYVFVGSMALLAGIGYLMLLPELGVAEAIRSSIVELLGVATITVVFFVSFREPIG
ncbi:MAG: PrsW family intramembrane metalloprotease [bacterium]|nr:PrsW family intramembrane metalloprotease [bacterium]